ncbi:MAG: D-alanine--D-alanine ligase [Oscillospiraceae bacterium]|nr:D-alanine--D-alanine ligase [Oscillospiraceae bacterium]
MRKSVLVLFNNQVLKAAESVINTISVEEYEIIPVGITKKGRWLFYPGVLANTAWEEDTDCVSAVLSPDNIHKGVLKIENSEVVLKKIDIIFSLLNVKGAYQGLFELTKIPFVGSPLSVTVACSDNAYTHAILEYCGVKTAKWKIITKRNISELDRECEKVCENLGLPLFVKPANSDEAFNKAVDINSLKECVKTAFLYDNKVLIEEYIVGRSLKIAMLGYDEEPIISFVKDKDDPNFVIENDLIEKVRGVAARACKILGIRGYAMIKLFLTDTEIILDEIDTQPDLSKDGDYACLMEDMGIEYQYLIERLINLAM